MIEAHLETIRLDNDPPKALLSIRVICKSCNKTIQEMLECKMFGTIYVACQDCGNETSLRYDPNALEAFTQKCLKINPPTPQQAARALEIIEEFIEQVIEATTP